MAFLRRNNEKNETPLHRNVRRRRLTVCRWLTTIGLAVVLLSTVALPAHAHVRVFLGFGLPVAPYPYGYAYAAPPCYAPYPPYVAYGAVPPPVWGPGYWNSRVGPWGRRARVWVPARVR